MATGDAPLVAIVLRDGSQLSVSRASVVVGSQFFELSRIQDARQVSPEPETFALRIAGTGLVEFQPARAGDGAIALEALFRLRPELRPAGFSPPPVLPPGLPPPLEKPTPPTDGYGQYPPYSGYAVPGYPPYPATPPMRQAWMNPNVQQGELTPYPRTFGETLSAAFQLYGKHFRSWLVIGLAVAFIPNAILGLVQLLPYLMQGMNPWGSVMNLPTSTNAFSDIYQPTLDKLTNEQAIVWAALAVVAIIALLVFQAWQIAAFAQAARDALFGETVRPGKSLRGGIRRIFPVMGAHVLLILITLVMFTPAIILFVVAIAIIGPSSVTDTTNLTPAQSTGALLGCAGFLAMFISAAAVLFFYFRFALGPYTTAADRTGVFAGFRRSWRISRGHWLRVFGVVIVISLVIGLGSLAISEFAVVSFGVSLLVVTPLYDAIATPLLMLAYMVLLYDLRLRGEGYATLQQEHAQHVPSHQASTKEG